MTTEGKPLFSDAGKLLDERTTLVESIVRRAFEQFLAPAFPEKLAVLAVGGFGRRELFPHSDVDLLLLAGRQSLPEAERSAVSAFLQNLWDWGLRISHSLRTPAECCELHDRNIELSVSLLDQRFLAGDSALYAKLEASLPRFLHGQRHDLARQLCRLARERHARQSESIHQLEPNIKEAPGGLRDYHLIGWLSQLHNAHPERLPARGPYQELEPARNFLYALRCDLHRQAGRDHNLLTFELQEQLGEDSPAHFMRVYFRHARDVHRAATRSIETSEEQASSLLSQYRDWRSRLSNAEFYVSRERVYLRAPHLLEQDPLLVLRLFQFVARHGFRLALESEQRVAGHLRPIRRYFAESHPLWPALNELLAAPHAALALRAMQETGVLGAVFPEWDRIECLLIRDFYHRYTVDEHTLRAIQALADLRTRPEPHSSQFAELLGEIDDPGLLVFAVLFHDTGKAGPSGEHVTESARLAECAMERIRMPASSRQMVRRLIDRHLDLSAAMHTRDPDEPATARFLADRVETVELLKRLTLLTWADISAVCPGALTPWRSQQLWRLYLVAHRELTRELETERIQAPTLEAPGKATFLEGFPVRYVRTHSAAEIDAHLALEQRSRERGVAVEIAKLNGLYQVTLVAQDRPSLLACIAGALSGFGLNILNAEGFSNRHGTLLDTFVFSDPLRTLELNPPEMDRLRLTLERVTLGKLDASSLLRNRPKPAPPSRGARITPSVCFDQEASDSATLIQIVAQDRPGLLYDLARTISAAGCNVELILIDTQAHKALDVFYVTAEGKKLSPARQAGLQESLLGVCKNQPE
jgi:[protein-PII] uridylyltransferase